MGLGSLLSGVVCVFTCKFRVFWDTWVQRVNAGNRKSECEVAVKPWGKEQCSVQG